MVEINHNKNIQRIIDRIKDDPNLFDKGETIGKLREVIFGNPNNDEKLAITQKPALYITTKNSIQNTNYSFGFSNPNTQDQITIEYEIVLLALSNEKTEKSQKQLYELEKNLRNFFSNNPRFFASTSNQPPTSNFWDVIDEWTTIRSYDIGDKVFFENEIFVANSEIEFDDDPNPPPPDNSKWTEVQFTNWAIGRNYVIDDNVKDVGVFYTCIQDHTSTDGDPLFSRSVINNGVWDSKTRGQLITSITFTLLATIGQTAILVVPGFGDLILLSDSRGEGRNSTEIHNDEGDTQISKGAAVGTRFFEYEYDAITYGVINNFIILNTVQTFTLKLAGGNTEFNGKLVFQRDSVRFDGIRTVIIQADEVTT